MVSHLFKIWLWPLCLDWARVFFVVKIQIHLFYHSQLNLLPPISGPSAYFLECSLLINSMPLPYKIFPCTLETSRHCFSYYGSLGSLHGVTQHPHQAISPQGHGLVHPNLIALSAPRTMEAEEESWFMACILSVYVNRSTQIIRDFIMSHTSDGDKVI